MLVDGSQVYNLASSDHTGLAANEDIKQKAIATLREYGTGTCSASNFYGYMGTPGSASIFSATVLTCAYRCAPLI
jgi:7-keto-8-aminopelargonate synthetase-like enzyme